MDDTAIRTEALSKTFGEIEAVAGLDLAVARGEIFGLVGPDGAGKTTTMRLLSGLLRPDAGRAEVAGVDVTEQPEQVRGRLGYLPQTSGLLPNLTVAESSDYFADLYCQPRAQVAERAEELLRATGLAEFTGRLVRDLSGGMKQKAALICALIHRPQVLLLDEPTRGVDPVSRRDLWRIIYGLPAEGVTVLVTTPQADEAERCNRVGVVVHGRLVALGTPQELVAWHTARLIELSTADQQRARTVLEQMDGVQGVSALGERLRVAVAREGPTAEDLARALERSGVAVVEVEVAEPRLGDALLAMSAGWGRDE